MEQVYTSQIQKKKNNIKNIALIGIALTTIIITTTLLLTFESYFHEPEPTPTTQPTPDGSDNLSGKYVFAYYCFEFTGGNNVRYGIVDSNGKFVETPIVGKYVWIKDPDKLTTSPSKPYIHITFPDENKNLSYGCYVSDDRQQMVSIYESRAVFCKIT